MLYKLVLANGQSIYFRGVNDARYPIIFYVDTNGKAKPNTFGRDIFQFEVSKNGGVYPVGQIGNTTADCNLNGGAGYRCAYYVLKYGNMNYLHKK